MKYIVLILSLLTSSMAFAECETTRDQIALDKAQETSLDVAGYDVVKFVGEFSYSKKMPTAEVTAEHAGFECEIVGAKRLKADYGSETVCWEISVDWSAGADLSGCELKISSEKESFDASLYMNY